MRKFFILTLAFLALTGFGAHSHLSNSTPFRKLSKSVVKITNMAETSGGTGFVARTGSGGSVLLSNWHVCAIRKEGERLKISRRDEINAEVKVIAVYPRWDLCVLESVPGLALTPGDNPEYLDALYVVGHPYLRAQTPSEGLYMSEVQEEVIFNLEPNGKCLDGFNMQFSLFDVGCGQMMTLQDTTAHIYPGNSGSPVINAEGDLVGVINSGFGPTSSGAMIPIRFVKFVLNQF